MSSRGARQGSWLVISGEQSQFPMGWNGRGQFNNGVKSRGVFYRHSRHLHSISLGASFIQVAPIYTLHPNPKSLRIDHTVSSSQSLILQQGEAELINRHCQDEHFLKPACLSHFCQRTMYISLSVCADECTHVCVCTCRCVCVRVRVLRPPLHHCVSGRQSRSLHESHLHHTTRFCYLCILEHRDWITDADIKMTPLHISCFHN